MSLSRSPDRNTFQRDAYIARCQKDGVVPSADYLRMYEIADDMDIEFEFNEEQHKNSLEYDLRTTDWILEKVRKSDNYAQNLYAAMCNNEFQKRDVWPILKDQRWSCTWRSAGGIIADMRQEGDYIDWYCSGIRAVDDDTYNEFVPESTVTEEIEADLLKLGWNVIPREDE